MFFYDSIRAALWFIAVAISLIPALHAVGLNVFTLTPFGCVSIINREGDFREAVFVIVVVGSLGISIIIDYLYINFSSSHQALKGVVILLMLGNILALAAGLVCFITLPYRGPVQDLDWLSIYYQFIIAALTIGIVTELVVSTANHHYGNT